MAGEDDKTYTQEDLDAKLAERDASEAGLKANRDELLGELKTLKAASKAYDGIDPKEYKTLKVAAAEAASKKAEADGDWEALKQQLIEQHGKDTDALKVELGAAHGSIEKLLVDARAVAAIVEAKGSPKVLLSHVKQFVKVVRDGEEYAVQVVDGNGTQRFKDGAGTPMTIEHLVQELRDDPEFAVNFEGSGSTGGGAAKSTGRAGGAKTIAAGDSKAFMANLEDIAKGTVEVR